MLSKLLIRLRGKELKKLTRLNYSAKLNPEQLNNFGICLERGTFGQGLSFGDLVDFEDGDVRSALNALQEIEGALGEYKYLEKQAQTTEQIKRVLG